MKKTFQYIISALAVILAVSCSQEQIMEGSGEGKPVIITATFDQNGTKSTLGDDGVTPNWAAGDEIWLSDGTNTSTVTVTEAGTTFSFEKPAALTGTTLHAVYPATAAKGVTDGNIGIEIPSYQDGTFANANICVAQTDGTSLSFKNATAILKFTQTTKGVNNIIISAPGISGTASVTYGETLTVPAVTGKSIYVRANSSPAIYIAVAPATLAVGTKFTFMTADKYLTQSTKADKSLSANDLVNMGSMDGYSITESLYVDLGLPSGTMWATMNVGATTSTDYGDYFAWGEVTPKSDYSWGTYKYCNGSYNTLTKYCSNYSYGYNDYTDSKTVLEAEDDAASVNRNGSWRIPTSDEWEELLNADNCTWQWTQVDGVNGYKVTGTKAGYTDKFIFLPAAGYQSSKSLYCCGTDGYYWSGSLDTSDPDCASGLYFLNNSHYNNKLTRITGRSVRPVYSVALEGFSMSDDNITIIDNQEYTLSVAPVPTYARIPKSCVWESSNTKIATVDQNGTVTAVASGTCTISVTAGGCSATCTVTVIHPEYVDLGLSVNWATYNVGATKPTDYGDYFAWGETSPYYDFGYAQEYPQSHWKTGKSAGYTWSSYKYCNGTIKTLTKYCNKSSYGSNGYTDSKTVLDSSDDAAQVNWMGSWRMPTKAEWNELLNADNCTWEWTNIGGVNGYKVTGKKAGYTDKFIFLPAAGYRPGPDYISPGSAGSYWSSSLYTSSFSTGDPSTASQLFFNSDSYNINSKSDRIIGMSVRPVFVVALEGVIISDDNISIFDYQKYSLSVAPVPTNARIQSCVWKSSNTKIATVDQNGIVTTVAPGTCTISVTAGGYSATCTVTVMHGYVDLGLSVKWATKNVGATKPTDYGDYFAWGEVTPKSNYSWGTYKYIMDYNSSLTQYSALTKYCTDSKYGNSGYTDNKTVLDSSDDAASVNWGGSWRMPTLKEVNELLMFCTWEWTNIDGVSGYKVTSKKDGYSDKFIFLPAAGLRGDAGLSNLGSKGHFWSSSLYTDFPSYACCLCFRSDQVDYNFLNRFCGQPVRPVCQ